MVAARTIRRSKNASTRCLRSESLGPSERPIVEYHDLANGEIETLHDKNRVMDSRVDNWMNSACILVAGLSLLLSRRRSKITWSNPMDDTSTTHCQPSTG